MRIDRAVAVIVMCLSAPCGVIASWDPYGEVRVAGGEAGNSSLPDPNAPGPVRGSQVDGALRMLLGLHGAWDSSTFDISYAPYGEVVQGGDPGLISHALATAWTHEYTSRVSLRIAEGLNVTPGRAFNPEGIRATSLPVGSSGTLANDVGLSLSFRESGRTTLTWTLSDSRRTFSSGQFVDSSHQDAGFEYRGVMSPHHQLVTGYEYGIYSFRDGLASAGLSVTGDPNVIGPGCDPTKDPNCMPTCDPARDPTCNPYCILHPLDPNCPVPLAAGLPLPGLPPGGQPLPPASGLGSARHRPYVGYVFDRSRGFHVDLRAGYDLLVFDNAALGSLSSPYVQSSLGWRWGRSSALASFGQGLDEGGGVFTNARMRNGRLDVHVGFTNRISLGLGAGVQVRESVLVSAGPAGSGTLRTSLGMASMDFILTRRWSLEAAYVRYDQKSTDLAVSLPDVRTSRASLGALWRFGRMAASPQEGKSL